MERSVMELDNFNLVGRIRIEKANVNNADLMRAINQPKYSYMILKSVFDVALDTWCTCSGMETSGKDNAELIKELIEEHNKSVAYALYEVQQILERYADTCQDMSNDDIVTVQNIVGSLLDCIEDIMKKGGKFPNEDSQIKKDDIEHFITVYEHMEDAKRRLETEDAGIEIIDEVSSCIKSIVNILWSDCNIVTEKEVEFSDKIAYLKHLEHIDEIAAINLQTIENIERKKANAKPIKKLEIEYALEMLLYVLIHVEAKYNTRYIHKSIQKSFSTQMKFKKAGVYESIEMAEDSQRNDVPEVAGMCVINTVERIVETLCKECGIEVKDNIGAKIPLPDLINRLVSLSIINENYGADLHKFLVAGNKWMQSVSVIQAEVASIVAQVRFTTMCIEATCNTEAYADKKKDKELEVSSLRGKFRIAKEDIENAEFMLSIKLPRYAIIALKSAFKLILEIMCSGYKMNHWWSDAALVDKIEEMYEKGIVNEDGTFTLHEIRTLIETDSWQGEFEKLSESALECKKIMTAIDGRYNFAIEDIQEEEIKHFSAAYERLNDAQDILRLIDAQSMLEDERLRYVIVAASFSVESIVKTLCADYIKATETAKNLPIKDRIDYLKHNGYIEEIIAVNLYTILQICEKEAYTGLVLQEEAEYVVKMLRFVLIKVEAAHNTYQILTEEFTQRVQDILKQGYDSQTEKEEKMIHKEGQSEKKRDAEAAKETNTTTKKASPEKEKKKAENVKKFAQAYEYKKQVEFLIANNIFDSAANTARNAVESIIKTLCTDCGMRIHDEDGKRIENEKLINRLKDAAIISEDIANNMHEIRKIGNKGSHAETVTLKEAKDVLSMLQVVLDGLNYDAEACAHQARKNNKPMENPDYYSSKRKYFGMWHKCRTREELHLIPEYFMLEKRANDGDIEAMLDIAIGFVSDDRRSKTYFDSNGMVCMPKYYATDGTEYYQDGAFDVRYYYWILKATNKAVMLHYNHQSDAIPKKYMATAYLEAIKFSFFALTMDEYKFYIKGIYYKEGRVQMTYENQFEYVKKMYGKSIWDELYAWQSILMGGALCALYEEHYQKGFEFADEIPIIASLHRERCFNQIQHLVMCLYFYEVKIKYEDRVAELREVVFGDRFTSKVLRHCQDFDLLDLEWCADQYSSNKIYYKFVANKFMSYEKIKARQEARRRQEQANRTGQTERTYSGVIEKAVCKAVDKVIPHLDPTGNIKDHVQLGDAIKKWLKK